MGCDSSTWDNGMFYRCEKRKNHKGMCECTIKMSWNKKVKK